MTDPFIDEELYGLLRRIAELSGKLSDGHSGDQQIETERDDLVRQAGLRGFPLTDKDLKRVERRFRQQSFRSDASLRLRIEAQRTPD